MTRRRSGKSEVQHVKPQANILGRVKYTVRSRLLRWACVVLI